MAARPIEALTRHTIAVIVIILDLNAQSVIGCKGGCRNPRCGGGKCGQSESSFFITVILLSTRLRRHGGTPEWFP